MFHRGTRKPVERITGSYRRAHCEKFRADLAAETGETVSPGSRAGHLLNRERANVEKQIEDLTKKLVAQCVGQNAGVVIGAAFNVAQTALNKVPDKRVLAAVAATLRNQADMIDKMSGVARH